MQLLADVLIDEKLRAQIPLQENPVVDAVIFQSPIVQKPMFLNMNVRHKDRVPEIVYSLRDSKADRIHKRWRKKASLNYFSKQ